MLGVATSSRLTFRSKIAAHRLPHTSGTFAPYKHQRGGDDGGKHWGGGGGCAGQAYTGTCRR